MGGIDAAVNIASSKRPVTVLASSPCWEESSRDPSGELAPYTRARLAQAKQCGGALSLIGGMRVNKVVHNNGKYFVHATRTTREAAEGAEQRSANEEDVIPDAAPNVF